MICKFTFALILQEKPSFENCVDTISQSFLIQILVYGVWLKILKSNLEFKSEYILTFCWLFTKGLYKCEK